MYLYFVSGTIRIGINFENAVESVSDNVISQLMYP